MRRSMQEPDNGERVVAIRTEEVEEVWLTAALGGPSTSRVSLRAAKAPTAAVVADIDSMSSYDESHFQKVQTKTLTRTLKQPSPM